MQDNFSWLLAIDCSWLRTQDSGLRSYPWPRYYDAYANLFNDPERLSDETCYSTNLLPSKFDLRYNFIATSLRQNHCPVYIGIGYRIIYVKCLLRRCFDGKCIVKNARWYGQIEQGRLIHSTEATLRAYLPIYRSKHIAIPREFRNR